MAIIKDLYFYPIKGLRGLRLNEMHVDPKGPRYDREWMIVDQANKFISMRNMPSLAKIGVRMEDDLEIELARADLGTCAFALGEREGDELSVELWKEAVPAFEVSAEVSAWLSEALAKKVRLVKMSEASERPTRFVDSKPFLVISAASMKGLEERMRAPMSIARFRPNVVVDQTLAHAEDHWGGFKAGSLEFKTVKPCKRCTVTTVHPLTGEMGEEPLKTLATYRRQEKGITFGQYYANVNTGRLKVGDQLQLL